MPIWAPLADVLLAWLAPPACAACDVPITRGAFCGSCSALVQQAPAVEIDGVPVRPAWTYAPPIAPALQRLKYYGRPDLAGPLARFSVPALSALGVQPGDLVVPVPLHPKRLAERGYNQAALLAGCLACAWRATFAPRALARLRHTTQQTRLSRGERLENLVSAIEARRPLGIVDKHVILVDDVVTTGSTARACIRALRSARARPRAVVAIALAAPGRDAGP